MTTTYNPIEGPFDTPPAVKPGTALVIASAAGFILHDNRARKAIAAAASASLPPMGEPRPLGETLAQLGNGMVKGSKVLFGAARRTSFGRKYLGGKSRLFYLVNIGRHRIATEFSLPSKEGTMYFIVEVACDARVIDPLGVVSDGVQDVCGHVDNELRRRLARVARDFSVQNLSAAGQKMQEELDARVCTAGFDRLIQLERGHVHPRLDAAAQTKLRQTEESELARAAVAARGVVLKAERGLELDAASDPDELLAAWLATGEPRYQTALQDRVQRMHDDDGRKIELLRMMFENKMIEPHDLHDRFPHLVDRVVSLILPGPAALRLLGSEAAHGTASAPTKSDVPRLEVRLPKRRP